MTPTKSQGLAAPGHRCRQPRRRRVGLQQRRGLRARGRVPASRLFDDDDLAERPVETCVDTLAGLNQAFFAHAGGDHGQQEGGRAAVRSGAERVHRRGGEHCEAGVVHCHHNRRGRWTRASEVS
jgi:hypothetical protein